MKNTMNKTNAWYSLRRTLPSWRFDELLAELLDKAICYKVDEVIIKVDTEELSHGHPSVEWLKAYQPKLLQAKEELAKRNIVYSLNPWITFGHADRGRNDYGHITGFQGVIGHDGSECKHCACPLSVGWQQHFAQLWTIYAETHPHIIWVEDDIRTFNHAPARYGCFCDLHLKKFSTIAGQKVSREEVVAAMLQPGKPHPWRQLYLEMQRNIMVETAGFIAKTVHAVSPETCMGLMSSGPRQHCLEGRDWQRFCAALADGNTLYSRPPMCNYNEDSLRGFYYSHDSIKLTRHVMPANTIEQSEVENVPFTRFSKSVNFTFLEMAISFAYGANGVTMNLYDHLGTPMEVESSFGKMLGNKKEYLNSLAQASQATGTFKGVQLLYHPRSSNTKELPASADYAELGGDGYEMMLALENAGIATTYEHSTVIAASGQTLRNLSDTQLAAMLKQGLLLDATAAMVLVERGFGADIGLKNIAQPLHRSKLNFVISAEQYCNPKFGGESRKYLTAVLPYMGAEALFSLVEPLPTTEIVSYWVNPDTDHVAPAMLAFENKYGGKVVIHTLDYRTGVGVAFHHPFRREQLHHVIRYLSKEQPELLFDCDGAFALAWRKDCEHHTVIGAFNFNLDKWQYAAFEMKWCGAAPAVTRLNDDGKWVDDCNISAIVSNNLLKIDYRGTVTFEYPLILKLS